MGLIDSAKAIASKVLGALTSAAQQKTAAINLTNPSQFIGGSTSQITANLPKDGFNIANASSTLKTGLSTPQDFGGSLLSGLSASSKGVENLTSGPVSFKTSGINSSGNILSGVKGFMSQVSSVLKTGLNIIKSFQNGILSVAASMTSSSSSSIGGVRSTTKKTYTTTTKTQSVNTTITNALPIDILSYIGTPTKSVSVYTETVSAISYTSLTPDNLSYILSHYETKYPSITTANGTAYTTDMSDISFKHLQSLLTLVKSACPNLQYTELINFEITKAIFDLTIIDICMKGVAALLDLLLGCTMYSDTRTSLILKDLVWDVAARGDVYTLDVMLNHTNTNLISSNTELLKILCLNADLSSSQAQTSLNNVYKNLNLTLDDIIILKQQYNQINQVLPSNMIYDVNTIAALRLTNPFLINTALTPNTSDMFIQVLDMFV
jgi:hypothetical protein